MSLKSRGGDGWSRGSVVSRKWTFFLCLGSFCAGLLFTNKMWAVPEPKDILKKQEVDSEKLNLVSDGCDHRSIASGKLRRATYVLHHLIGVVVAYASQLRELKRSTKDVEKAKTLYGVQFSDLFREVYEL